MEREKIGPVRRLLFRWQDGKWQVVNERRIEKKVIPQTQTLPKIEKDRQLIGFWFEVSDSKGKILYRQIINDPLRQQIEVPNVDGTFTNVPIVRKDITFEVMIPDNKENATLTFFGTDEKPIEKKVVLRKMAQLDLSLDYRRKQKEPEEKRGE